MNITSVEEKHKYQGNSITFEQLNQGQRDIFEAVKEALGKPGSRLCINGPAGTGKTTLTKFIVEYAVKSGILGIVLAAPTHTAKRILSQSVGMQAETIHSLMKINPNTYEENQIFEQREMPDMSKVNVLICDEASFYDRKLFDIILNTVPSWCIILAFGDDAQLRPVAPGDLGNTNPPLSPFFTDPRFKQYGLTEVMRSNAPIITVATDIRQGKWIYPLEIDGQGVYEHAGDNGLKSMLIKFFSNVKTADDLYENRIFAYTNKSVEKLNQIVRKHLYKATEYFLKDEVIVMQEPLLVELNFEGKTFKEVIFNNGENVRINRIFPAQFPLSARNVDANVTINYFRLDVVSIDEENEGTKATINVIADPNEQQKLEFFLAKTAGAYKSGQVKAYWKDFWAVRNKFSKVKALPARTIHKAQGCSVDNSYLYTPCMHVADTDLALQLLYVGATRARHNLHYV